MKEKDNKEKARELYQSGYGSLAKIAKTLGENPNTVKAWKKRDKEKGSDWVKMGAKKVAPKKEMGAPEDEEIKKVAKQKRKKIKEMEDKLTEKQKLFAYYYIQSFNGTQSAIKAGYSSKSAFVEASRQLKNDKVRELIEELKKDFSDNIGLTTQMVVNRHAKIAFSNIFDFVDGQRRLKPVEEIDGTLVSDFTYKTENSTSEYGDTSKTTLKLKVEDRKNSLNFLTKYTGLDKALNIAEEKLKIDKVRAKIDIEKHTGAGKGKNKLAEAVKKNHEARVKADDRS